MKLYYSPGACSLGIHVLLEEIGKPYEAEALDLKSGVQYQPPYVEVNPKSKVPTVERDDGSVLTEFGAIATWLARANPAANLMPHDPEQEARAIEAMDYIIGTIHMLGFARIFRPTNFNPDEAGQEAVVARGREIASKGLALIDHKLQGQDYLAGSFSAADAALFYVSVWAGRMNVELPPNVAAHFTRMKQRPAVRRTMEAEGLPV